MQERADTELLRQYAEQDSEAAFATLVTRHVNLVYSAAVRKTGNPHAAEEITQAVFIILARKAHALRKETILSGWLYQTARLTAANFVRNEIRRVRREQESYMQSLSNETEAWPQIEPLLDDAMGRLNEKERNAIVLRFFEGRSFQEIGTAFGGSENAAKKRVIRGLEKLRKFFARRGVRSTAAILAGAISANSIQAAPVALAKSVAAVAIAKGAAASASTLTLIKGALKIMAWAKAKTVIVTGIVVILAAGTTVVVTHHNPRVKPGANPPASPSTGAYSMNFTKVDTKQVLEVYRNVSGLDLSISPEVNRIIAGITLKYDRLDQAEAVKLIEQALLEQAGIVITKNGSKATATFKGTPVAHPMPPASPPAAAVPPK